MTTVFVEIEDMSLWLHSNQFLWFYSIWKHENVQVSLYKLTTNGNYMHRHNWQFWNTAWGELVSSSNIEGCQSLTQWLNGCKFCSFPPSNCWLFTLKIYSLSWSLHCFELLISLSQLMIIEKWNPINRFIYVHYRVIDGMAEVWFSICVNLLKQIEFVSL